jgi:hypothetical protein
LLGMLLLIALSVLSTFLGAQRARWLFNTLPLGALWCALATLLLTGLLIGVIRRTSIGILAMHAGGLLVLLGGLSGSRAACDLRALLWRDNRISRARVLVRLGQPEHRAFATEANQLHDLGFDLRLDALEVEHYGALDWRLACSLGQRDAKGEILYGDLPERIDWRLGVEVPIPHTDARLRVLVQVQPRPDPDSGEAPPPALEFVARRGDVEIRRGLGAGVGLVWAMRDLYNNEQAWEAAGLPFLELYAPDRPVRHCTGQLVASRDGSEEARATVRANHPMHHGGYHLYLEDYDRQDEQWALLLIVSDAGLVPVLAGFALLLTGAGWCFWVRPAARAVRRRAHQ